MQLLTSSMDDLRRSFKTKLADDTFRNQVLARLAEPDLRDEVIAALPDDCVEQCRNLQFDLYPRMLLRKLMERRCRERCSKTDFKDRVQTSS
jgi:hypothetical protein